ncbi:VOC family protein [Microbacterium sp. Marseille-Q6965]|uniref:VOC family protein n=1 Tax=Microbacterium sp. Marseille-Q6965 TaxID=2965072 RepID=UPI0021B6FD43|nr:VOC family protein [Microbacterium sp. Marseille-Q6965]
MSLSTTTHLNLPGTAREALTFYQGVFGGHIHVTTYGELGMPQDAPDAGKVVFGSVQADNGFRVMAYDIPGRSEPFAGRTTREHGMTHTEAPFFLSVRADSLDEARGYWDKLADGATIIEPLAASEWSAGFGMLTDAFGVTWSVDVASSRAA